MASTLRNVVVVGGSYVGSSAAKELANLLPATHRVVLIDPHSHFHHLFAFPRFAILPGYEHKAFIPYSGVFAATPDPSRHTVIQAKVMSLQPKQLTLDREWQGSKILPFDYLVAATGTRLPSPGSMLHNEKVPSVEYLQSYQRGIKDAKSVIVVGGGAVGVQMACDLKELYPDKEITLVHSRDQLMPVYHEKLSDMIKTRFKELNVNLTTGSRAVVPQGGFDNNAKPINLTLQDGRTLEADFVIQATGQIPNNQFLNQLLESSAPNSLINPNNGFIRVKPTLQFQNPEYSHLYAVGDIADTGAHKAARPGAAQAAVAAKNIAAMIAGKEPAETIVIGSPGIHLTLGLTKNTIFRNPGEGETEPFINLKNDGRADMGIDGVWERRGVKVSSPNDYRL
ncbi:uncharacterized protein BCR38DRAFT_483830 [Pseudomassariella vexata]|uniref:FAD/NAD(P)-binding domain-containing protein n=1 Tax=Pseudomassariella vexata TaxID=1141098 RepID=A0A1Y2E3T6_9PEZI|nr:uncharacterized protein BCR38DRAFT_483830 [Pseudomassariella vexata]ORY66179.1 hypothetical protein BCR38DRAFT_483830 [Pseudomassariella vexata]